MIAVAKIGGHQAIVKVGDKMEVDKIDLAVGKTVDFEVLLVSEEDGGDFKIGTPILAGIVVQAKILNHGRGKKIKIFKMKPRKRYRKTKGHRQDYTEIEITGIKAGTVKKVDSKKEVAPTAKTPVVKKEEETPKKVAKSDKKA